MASRSTRQARRHRRASRLGRVLRSVLMSSLFRRGPWIANDARRLRLWCGTRRRRGLLRRGAKATLRRRERLGCAW